MNAKAMNSYTVNACVLLLGLVLLAGCAQTDRIAHEEAPHTAVFSYDRAHLPKVKPWTSDSFKNDPDDFQFAVIGDRTGGADARGIFDRAMDQLNLLQPEFVINVGDAVEGYTKDAAKANAQWEEFEDMVQRLEMPFFYTVGNHDLSNDTMEQVWLERRGAYYYHFVYRDVLFLVLNSEDPPRPSPPDIEEKIELYNKLQVSDPEKAKTMLDEFMASVASYLGKPANFSEQQVAYVKKALAQNANVRWTFVLLHEPAWENPSENFLEIERLLKDRDYTFFAGHLHYYDHKERDRRDYITMGPAGASFHKDGPGNVDHILWVTMTDDGPQIAKITLDGIYDRRGRDLTLKEIYDRSRKEQ